MEVKVVIVGGADDDIDARRTDAVKLSHKFLKLVDDKKEWAGLVHPHTLMMMLAHTFSHILMAAPNEECMRAAMVDFLKEVDYNDLVEMKNSNAEADTLGEPISRTVN